MEKDNYNKLQDSIIKDRGDYLYKSVVTKVNKPILTYIDYRMEENHL